MEEDGDGFVHISTDINEALDDHLTSRAADLVTVFPGVTLEDAARTLLTHGLDVNATAEELSGCLSAQSVAEEEGERERRERDRLIKEDEALAREIMQNENSS